MQTTSELYQQKYEAQMHEWSAKLEGLKARTELMTVQAKLDIKPSLDAVHDKYEAVKARFSELRDASSERWEEIVTDIDRAWDECKAAIEGAYRAIEKKVTD